MRNDARPRFLLLSAIRRGHEVISEQCLRSGVLCDAPAVRFAVFVLHINKVTDSQICLHLKPRYHRVKAGVPALAVIAKALELFRQQCAALGHCVIDRLILAGRKPVVITGVKVISIPTEIGKVGKPLPADKACPAAEKFSIYTASASGDWPFPFPRAVRFFGKPQLRRAAFLHREAGDLPCEKGQEAPFLRESGYVLRVAELISFHSASPSYPYCGSVSDWWFGKFRFRIPAASGAIQHCRAWICRTHLRP